MALARVGRDGVLNSSAHRVECAGMIAAGYLKARSGT